MDCLLALRHLPLSPPRLYLVSSFLRCTPYYSFKITVPVNGLVSQNGTKDCENANKNNFLLLAHSEVGFF